MKNTRKQDNSEPAANVQPSPAAEAGHVAAAHHEHHVPVLSSPGTGRRVAIAVVALALVLAAVFAYGLIARHRDAAKLAEESRASVEQPPPVEVVHVHRSSPNTLLNLPGEVRAFHET